MSHIALQLYVAEFLSHDPLMLDLEKFYIFFRTLKNPLCVLGLHSQREEGLRMDNEGSLKSQIPPEDEYDSSNDDVEDEHEKRTNKNVMVSDNFVGAQFICDEDYQDSEDEVFSDEKPDHIELFTGAPVAGKRPRQQFLYRQAEHDEIFDLTTIFQQNGIDMQRAISICRAWIALMTAITGTKKIRTKKNDKKK